jgi:hypothetical protein
MSRLKARLVTLEKQLRPDAECSHFPILVHFLWKGPAPRPASVLDDRHICPVCGQEPPEGRYKLWVISLNNFEDYTGWQEAWPPRAKP